MEYHSEIVTTALLKRLIDYKRKVGGEPDYLHNREAVTVSSVSCGRTYHRSTATALPPHYCRTTALRSTYTGYGRLLQHAPYLQSSSRLIPPKCAATHSCKLRPDLGSLILTKENENDTPSYTK